MMAGRPDKAETGFGQSNGRCLDRTTGSQCSDIVKPGVANRLDMPGIMGQGNLLFSGRLCVDVLRP